MILRHTLKLSELARAAIQTLPHLQHLAIEMRTYSWGEIYMSRLETTLKDGILWIGKHNLTPGFSHDLSRRYGD